MTDEEIEKILDALQATHRKGQKLAIHLQFQGKSEEVAQVREKNQTLARQIDELLVKNYQSCQLAVAGLNEELKKANSDLQKAIRDVKKKIKTAEKVAKGMKNLDKAIEMATKVLAA